MTEFEAFKILFHRLSVRKMVEIYNNHFSDSNICRLTTYNINQIFTNKTPYDLLQLYSTNIDIRDQWLAKDHFELDEVWYSYSDEEIMDYIIEEIDTLYKDIVCWHGIISLSDLQTELYTYIAERIRERFSLGNSNISYYYVSELHEWELEKSNEYNFYKFKQLYQYTKSKYENHILRYAETIFDEDDIIWHYENQLSYTGYIDLNL